MSAFDPAAYLSDELLERIRSRAATVDAENRFPEEDLADLKDAGYLSILVPRERGGAGLGLAEASVLQQRLATAAPATAWAATTTFPTRRACGPLMPAPVPGARSSCATARAAASTASCANGCTSRR